MQKLLTTLLLSATFCASAAQYKNNSDFKIKSIELQGLQRITKGTVFSYLPVRVGDTLTPAESTQIITDLYKTHFFSDIQLARSGDTLVIKVHELPVIGSIHLSGNKDIPTKKLMKVLNQNGFSEGETYNRVFIKEIKQSLQEQYYSSGKYNARVEVVVSHESRNRVGIDIKISEGVVARIKSINIVGDHIFSQDDLLDQLTLTTPGWFTWISGSDKYAAEKLQQSLTTLSDYYMDRGYLDFRVTSAQVALTPDHKSVYITINVHEGEKYTFSGYKISGKTILPLNKLKQSVTIKAGQVFSRQIVIGSDKAISRQLGNVGYAFAHVKAIPHVDKKNKRVFLDLKVIPGQKTYVNQIHFSGNSSINDAVLRRNMRQMEGGVWNTDNVQQSKWRMQQLPYIQNITMSTEPVPGTNKVNVDYKVTQKNSANFTASLGYSQLDGIIISAGVTEHDFLGTGKTVGFNFQKSRGYQSYSVSYMNPYDTMSGISRSINAYFTKADPGKLNLTDSYTISQTGISLGYDIPISESLGEQQDLSFGYGIEHTKLDIGTSPPEEISKFVKDHGTKFTDVNLTAGWSSNGFDRVIFPTDGFTQSLNGKVTVPLTKKSIGYYTVGYSAEMYHPISANHHFILKMKGSAQYGGGYWRSKQMPFYENFYAGGIDSVRGYEGNSLGPRFTCPVPAKGQPNTCDSDNPAGGNLSVYGTVGLVVPSLVAQNSLRTTVFIDGGSVFNTHSSRYKFDAKDLRYSAGVEFDWLTPLGAVNISLARPLNAKKGDETQFFQFSIGKTF